jgi:hypothetical protein
MGWRDILQVAPEQEFKEFKEINTPTPDKISQFPQILDKSVVEKNYLTTRAKGYGCDCGHNLYHQTENFIEEPEDTKWEHQYRLCKVWQCENCKATYEFIGGTRGAEYIN